MTTLSKIDGASPPSDPVGSEAAAAVESAAASPTAMCSAIPAAVRNHNWQEPRTCASAANCSVLFGGEYRPTCRMHHQAWQRAMKSGGSVLLATQWGWT